MREEVKPVIDALLRYQQTGIANNVLILGSRGSGKSVLARYLMNLMARQGPLVFAYANCRRHNTSVKVLAALFSLRPRGCSLDELWQKFEDSRAGRIVFVLDEVDLTQRKGQAQGHPLSDQPLAQQPHGHAAEQQSQVPPRAR
jgi:Cdc6-like AAA superfamily ATPase